MISSLTYLDWAATAPLCEPARDAMMPYMQPGVAGLEQGCGNANSLYEVGRVAFRALEQARETIARFIGARPNEVIFTSGATEADNAALFGIFDACMMRAEQKGQHDFVPHVVVSSIEHEAVLEAARVLSRWGAEVSFVDPDPSGHITPELLEAVLTERTVLVSIMAVNNEVGSVMDVAGLACAAHKVGAQFHVDATQALGKVAFTVKEWGVDALSFSSHKVGGPKGVGALFLKARTPFSAQLVGGGQELGLRSGTQNVMGAVGFAAACSHALNNAEKENQRLYDLRDECYRRFATYDRVRPSVAVDQGSRAFAPHIVNVVVRGFESETLIMQLDRLGVCVSGGSACTSHNLEPSHVLTALGISKDDALGALRLSFGHETTQADIEAFFTAFDKVLESYG